MTSGGPPDGEPAPRTVVSVELKGASGESVRIHLSDGSFFVLHAEVFAREGISAGTPIDPEREAHLLTRSELVLARLRALSLLSRSAQTRQGLTRKLRARGFSAAAVAHAIARVSELGYLDDRAFAESWVQARIAQRRDGVKALTLGLMRRGVAKGDCRGGGVRGMPSRGGACRGTCACRGPCPARRHPPSHGPGVSLPDDCRCSAGAEGEAPGNTSRRAGGVNPKDLRSTWRGRSRTCVTLSITTESEEQTVPAWLFSRKSALCASVASDWQGSSRRRRRTSSAMCAE